jgi:hypothetical protein
MKIPRQMFRMYELNLYPCTQKVCAVCGRGRPTHIIQSPTMKLPSASKRSRHITPAYASISVIQARRLRLGLLSLASPSPCLSHSLPPFSPFSPSLLTLPLIFLAPADSRIIAFLATAAATNWRLLALISFLWPSCDSF